MRAKEMFNELIFGFESLDLKDHFSASLSLVPSTPQNILRLYFGIAQLNNNNNNNNNNNHNHNNNNNNNNNNRKQQKTRSNSSWAYITRDHFRRGLH